MHLKKKMTYEVVLERWLEDKKIYIKESTYASYLYVVRNYITPYLGDYLVSQIDHKLIQEYFLKFYRQTDKFSDRTIKGIATIVKSSLRWSMNEGYINYFELSFKYPRISRRSKVFTLTKREQNKITNYALENITPQNIGLLLALYAGLRIGEICALKWKDIDLKRGIIHVRRTIQRIYMVDIKGNNSRVIISSPKTQKANRDIPINKFFLNILNVQKDENEFFVISAKEHYIEPRTYRRYFDRTLKKLHIDHINFHALRHTFATNCIALGVDYKTVSELLGHSNINITLNLYIHPRLAEKKKCIDLVSKIFQEKAI